MALIFDEQVIQGTVDGASVSYTKSIPHRCGYAVQIKYSGTTINGNVKLQASLNNVDYIDIEDTQFNFTDDSGGVIYDNKEINYNFLKIVCTSNSGAITFQAWLVLKRPNPIE